MLEVIVPVIILTIYVLFPIVLWVFLSGFGIKFFRVDIESFVLINLFAYSYVGIIPLFFEIDSYRVSLGIRGDITLVILMICSVWSIMSLAFGLVVARRVFPMMTNVVARRSISSGQIVATCVMIVVCFGVLAAYLSRVDNIALFSAVSGDARHAALERSAMTNGFPGNYHRYSWFMHEVLWCISLVCLAALLVKRNLVTVILFFVAFAGMVFTTTMSAQKGPLVWYLISLAFLYLTVRRGGRISPIWAIGLMLSALVMITTIYVIIYNESISWAFFRVLSRTFAGQLTPAYAYLQYFPDQHGFLLGRSFPNPGGILPYEPFRLTVEIMNWMAPHLAERGIVGSSPTVFWGEVYANFGFWGVAIVPFFVGLWVGTVSGCVKLLPPSPIVAGFVVWLAFHFSDLASTGVSKFVVDVDLVVVATMMLGVIGVGWALDRFVFDRLSGTHVGT